jgi:hypothetical protein
MELKLDLQAYGFKEEKKHTTNDELKYITNIGRYSEHTLKIPREEMLEKYLAVSILKQNWGDIDKKTALTFASNELKRERGY